MTIVAETAEDWRAGGFGVYVHWPFCLSKCPYCDFNSHVSRDVDQDRWRRAMVAEIGRAASLTPGREVGSIFFGGGTPSLMPPETVAAAIEACAKGWRLSPAVEITLEANPTSVEAARFAGYAAAGVNRVSVGVQALNDADLRRLGRTHDAAEALGALDVARAAFDRVSFDLIYARQDQTAAEWERELSRALALASDHLSLYQLTIEPGTRFGEMFDLGRLRGLPEDGAAADMYEITQDLCEAAGMPAYEVSNHARPGAEGRHNLVYWRYGDYAGIGPGAHGRLTLDGARLATEAPRQPGRWLEAAERGEGWRSEAISPEAQAEELLLMGMRLSEGVETARHERLSGAPLDPGRVGALMLSGHLAAGAGRLRATPQGRLALNAVLRDLLA